MLAKPRLLAVCLFSIFSVILLSPGAALPVSAQSSDAVAKIDAFLNTLTDSNTFSGSVLIARGDEVIFTKGYGYATRDFAVPNTPQTLFRIGSITKQFTAMAILQLQEASKLSVHDPICTYVKDCPAMWTEITIEHLLTHTSGIPDSVGSTEFMRTINLSTTPSALVRSFSDKPVLFKPGKSWQYSNSNYILLGVIIATVSGDAYPVYIRKQITEPLGLKDTQVDNALRVIPNRAVGYSDKDRLSTYIDMTIPYAAGALLSTVEDLHRWTRALFTGKVVRQTSLDAMIAAAVQIPGAPAGVRYGYGLGVDPDRIYHGGSIFGFVSDLEYYPQEEITIVVLCNLEKANPEYVAQFMWEALTGKKRGS